MRVTENMTTNNAIFNINKSQNKLNKLNELLSSNQNINRPSDDPIGTRQILDLQSQVSSMNQYMSNIQNGQTWTDVANTALQGMNDFLVQAKSAASNILAGTNDSVSVTNALATLENVRQQMIDLANVQVGDQYVFGGFNNAAPVVSNKKLGGVVDISKPPNQITGIDTTGLIVGMTVSGKGILPDTKITNIDNINKIVTLSKNPISSGSGFDYTFGLPPTTQKGNTSLSSTQFQITGISTTGLNVGDQVTGPGVPFGTTIASIDNAGQVTISKALTQAITGGSFNFVPRIFQTGDADAVTGLDKIYGVAFDTTNLSVGDKVTGPGVQAGTTIASIDIPGPGFSGQITLSQPLTQAVTGGNFAFTSTIVQTGNVDATTGLNIISGLDTTNLVAGDIVKGPNLPPGGTTIAGMGPGAGQVTLTTPLSSAVSGGVFTFTHVTDTPVGTQTGSTSLTSTQITGLDTTNLKAGMSISGPGVPANSIIAKIDSASQITISQPLTQAVTGGTFTFLPTISVSGGSTTALTNTITGLADPTGLLFSVGMSVSGPNIPNNTEITSIDTTTTPGFPIITLNNNATLTAVGGTFTFGPTITKAGTTNPPNQITGLPLAQLQNLYIGMKVTGPGLPDNTTITDIDTTDNNGTGSITLSKIPTGPGGAGQFVFEGYIDSYGDRTMMGTVTTGSSTISGLPSTTNMINAPVVSKSGSTDPSVNPNQITGLADTNGLMVGMPITDNAGGTIIPPNTIVTGIDPVAKSITLSNPFIPPTTKAGVTNSAGMTSAVDLTAAGTIAGGVNIVAADGTISNGIIGGAGGLAMVASAVAAPLTITVNGQTTTIGTYDSDVAGLITNVTYNGAPIAVAVGVTQPITFTTGAGLIGSDVALAATTGTVTAIPPNQITGIDTTNLLVGMPVTGPGIPANTTITGTPTSIPPTAAGTITLSNNITASAPAGIFTFAPTTLKTSTGVSFNFSQPISKTGSTSLGNNQITGLADTNSLFVGMPVSDNAGGTIIPANTTITAIDPVAKTITLSNPASASAAGTKLFFTPTMPKISQAVTKTGAADPVATPFQITGLANTNSLFVGMPISDNAGGTIIPPNTTITAIDTLTNTITLSNNPLIAAPAGTFSFTPVVAGANQIAVDTTNLFVGMPVTGPGIPPNTTITEIPPTTTTGIVRLSNAPTVTEQAGTYYFGQYSSMGVNGTGITPNSTVGAIVNNNSLNLSTAATATSSVGGTQLTFSGHFAAEDIKVNINKSSQVALNYSVSKLLLGGAPPATTQASGPPPSTLPVNILGTIGELITAIQNKDDAGIIAAASNLKTATDQVNLAQTEYAGRAIRLESAKTMLTNNQNTLKNIISNKQTLDTAKTIVQLQQQTTAYQAALQGTAKILPLSLLDYLR